jgi:hypothetical protein
MQAAGLCCRTRQQAALSGHYDCYSLLLPYEPEGIPQLDLFFCLRAALQHEKNDFAARMLAERPRLVSKFVESCVCRHDAVSLRFVLDAFPGLNLMVLTRLAANLKRVNCLRLLLQYGAPWDPKSLWRAARDNRLDILEVALAHSREWCPKAPGVAGGAGNARFLMRAFAAGCPIWTSAADGEPAIKMDWFYTRYYPPGRDVTAHLEDLTLVVSSDLVRSGPVLLLAAQKGVPLTPRMEGMLGEVRRRALALAGCFHRAARLSQGPAAHVRTWKAMGQVPVELVQSIATLARVSIFAQELVA